MLALVVIEVIFQPFILFNQLGQLTHRQGTFDQGMYAVTEMLTHFFQGHHPFTHTAVQHGSRQGIFIDMQMRQNIGHFNSGIQGIGPVLDCRFQLFL